MEHQPAAEIFTHIRILLGMVVGLGVTRLLSGVARVIQHPDRHPPYPIHLGWVAFALLMLVDFWWWEISLFEMRDWTFTIYLYLIGYAVLLFLLCAFLFPESLDDYKGYDDFFYARRVWFFGTLALIYVIDLADAALKGRENLLALGAEYLVRTPVAIALCLIAIATRNRLSHGVLIVAMLGYEIAFIIRQLDRM